MVMARNAFVTPPNFEPLAGDGCLTEERGRPLTVGFHQDHEVRTVMGPNAHRRVISGGGSAALRLLPGRVFIRFPSGT